MKKCILNLIKHKNNNTQYTSKKLRYYEKFCASKVLDKKTERSTNELSTAILAIMRLLVKYPLTN